MGRRLWISIVLLAVGMMAVAVIFASTKDADELVGLGVLPVPAVGRTEPGELHDGHAVFVAHDLDGTISVLNATSTHLATDPMGWCANSRTIDDILLGARWDAQGRYVSGPSTTDLGSYEYAIDERSNDIVVLMYVVPRERTSSPLDTITYWCAERGGYEIHPRGAG